MLTQAIQATCPCSQSPQKQTDFSRNLRISFVAIGVILLLVSVLIIDGYLPLWVEVEWITTSLGFVLLGLGLFARCVQKKKKDPLGCEEDVYPTSSTRGLDKSLDRQTRSTGRETRSQKKETEDPHLVQAEAYLKKGEREKALKEIDKSRGGNAIKNPFIFKLASIYFDEGNLDAAFETVKTVWGAREKQEAVFVSLARAYLEAQNKKKAYQAIDAIFANREAKNALFLQLATLHIADDEYEMALKMIGYVFPKNEQSDQALLNLAAACLKDHKELAFTALKEVRHASDKKDELFLSLAKSYAPVPDVDSFLTVIKEVRPTNENRNALIYTVAKELAIKGEYRSAFKLLIEMCEEKRQVYLRSFMGEVVNGNENSARELFKEISYSESPYDEFFATLAQEYFKRNKEEIVAEMVQVLFKYSAYNFVTDCGKFHTTINLDWARAIKEKELEIYMKAKVYFDTDNPLQAFKAVRAEGAHFAAGFFNKS